MTRVLLVSALTLSMAGVGLGQLVETQAYSEGSQFGQYNPYIEQSSPYSSQSSGQFSPYSEPYNPYASQSGQYVQQSAPATSWEPSGMQRGQSSQMSTPQQWMRSQSMDQGGYSGWAGAAHPYGFAGYGNYGDWSQSAGTGPSMAGNVVAEQQGMSPMRQAWKGNIPENCPGFAEGYGGYARQTMRSMTPWQGQRIRLVGAIEQQLPANRFSMELNPNDVLVSVRTQDGREQLVDLGPGAEAATFAPNVGSRVMISGHITWLNGQPVLIANRAHEIGAGAFQEAGYGERSFHKPGMMMGRSSFGGGQMGSGRMGYSQYGSGF